MPGQGVRQAGGMSLLIDRGHRARIACRWVARDQELLVRHRRLRVQGRSRRAHPYRSVGGVAEQASATGARRTELDGTVIVCLLSSILAVKCAGEQRMARRRCGETPVPPWARPLTGERPLRLGGWP